MNTRVLTHVIRPESAQDIVDAFDLARESNATLCCWGNGRSYGDAALNDGQITLDMREMRSIEAFDEAEGIITVQPGLTLEELWKHVLPRGFWPPVVSGTMRTTVGGCAAANVHGKNNFAHGPFGDHVLGFTLVTPSGEIREVTRESDPNLFHAAVGGFGALGVFTSVTLRLKRVASGRVEVQPESHPDLGSMFRSFEGYNDAGWDYVVGWIDAFGQGSGLGRGNLHAARYVTHSEDPEGRAWLDVSKQALPSTVFGVPKRWLWRLMKPFASRWGMRLINELRFRFASRASAQQRHLQSHAGFNFLLDYVPDWKRVYAPHGLIQFQIFVPASRAPAVFRKVIEVQQATRYESYLLVMKRHRPDSFWLSHALDGFSLAMDFPVLPRRRGDLLAMARRFEQIVVEAGGRFYLAKDSVISPQSFRASLGDEILARFFGLRAQLDPDGLLGGNLYRRLLGPLAREIEPRALEDGEVFSVGASLSGAVTASEPPSEREAEAATDSAPEAAVDSAPEPSAELAPGAVADPAPEPSAEPVSTASPEPATARSEPVPPTSQDQG